MHTKPTLFFSHSSKDKRELGLIKDLFVNKTGSTIDVFVSSDGQSIPFGRNWVHKVEEALNGAKLLFAFITPNSLHSNWVLFEAGFAYSKGVRVIPVGFLGIDIAHVPPPLGLLQGFNIGSSDGLDNLIALANEEFGHTHELRFSQQEYDRITERMSNATLAGSAFGRLVYEVQIFFFFTSKNYRTRTLRTKFANAACSTARMSHRSARITLESFPSLEAISMSVTQISNRHGLASLLTHW